MRHILHYQKTFIYTAAFFVATISFIFAIFLQSQSELRNEAQQRLHLASNQLDAKIDYINNFVTQELNLKPITCDDKNIIELQQKILLTPYIRNILFANKGIIYCSAIHGPVSIPFDTSDTLPLSFPDKNHLPPYSPVGLFHKQKGNFTIIGVYGIWQIVNELATLHGNSPLYFSSGHLWLETNGKRFSKPPFTSSKGYVVDYTSYKYNYRISTIIPWVPSWSYFWRYSKSFVISILILCLIVFKFTCHYLTKFFSPLKEMKAGLNRGEFIPWLQPVNDSSSGSITGCEILMRWQHPIRGIVPPMEFIPLAEESGLIVPMTEKMLGMVKDTFLDNKIEFPEGFYFSLNVTANHILQPSLLNACRNFLSIFNKSRVRLILEITERDKRLMDEDIAIRAYEFKELGILIAIDDFGTGYAGMSALQSLPIDMLKIDRTFITKVLEDGISSYIIRSIVFFSQNLHIQTIAEGVENAEQLQRLQHLGVDYIQGYFFSKPLPLEKFIATQLK